jgi:hypothetical protein
MNRLTVPLLVVCVALAGWAVWERVENSRLTARVAALEDQAGKRQAPGDKESVLAAALSKTGGKPGSSAAAKESPDAGAATAQPGEEGKSMADGFAKMMRDPKMREAMKAQASMGIDMMYRDLFDLLDLPEPKRSEFEKLIREKTTAGMEIGFAMMGEKKTPEEMKAVSEDLQAKTKAMETKFWNCSARRTSTKCGATRIPPTNACSSAPSAPCSPPKASIWTKPRKPN